MDVAFSVGGRAGFLIFFRVAKVVLTLRVRLLCLESDEVLECVSCKSGV